jgi:hypothetical protein
MRWAVYSSTNAAFIAFVVRPRIYLLFFRITKCNKCEVVGYT